MTARDRIVIVVLGALALLAAAYIGVVSPEQKKASAVEAKVSSAKASLSAAEAKLSEAKSAQRRYADAYSTIVSLGEAVPADEQVPSLIYELDHAAGHDHVQFQTISSGGSSSSASVSATTVQAAGFQQLPFTFTFTGTFFDLYHLMYKLQGFTVALHSGGVKVSGRLLTIQSVQLSGGGSGSGGAASAGSGSESSGPQQLTGTVTATAYVLPPGEALTAGATPTGPAGTQSASTSSASSPSAPAVVKAPTP